MFFPENDQRMQQIFHQIIMWIHLKVRVLKCMAEIWLHYNVPGYYPNKWAPCDIFHWNHTISSFEFCFKREVKSKMLSSSSPRDMCILVEWVCNKWQHILLILWKCPNHMVTNYHHCLAYRNQATKCNWIITEFGLINFAVFHSRTAVRKEVMICWIIE